ncbi:hypothetical protein Hbl1158_06340 [Halobaculum sp. CBA1158]|uniref:DUF7511 domain-containing protein n=1 Tax=Halobaculum sp. CBA1158 TaxID=2904243 RepID=UPI001F3FCBFB|nr:hypothetical protein [Halobaculum sp. CBA1158]UIP00972.1 hypothetical protein Hbl1158_06340 [Halobaculum sp. CBA1158]
MSASDERPALEGERLTDLPEFELRYLLDDGERPTEVTVYAPESLETTWLTVDASATVSLEEVR